MVVGEGGSGLEEGRKRAEECREEEGGVSTLRMEVRRSRATCSGEGWRHQQGQGQWEYCGWRLERKRMGGRGRENEAGGCVCRERKTFT